VVVQLVVRLPATLRASCHHINSTLEAVSIASILQEKQKSLSGVVSLRILRGSITERVLA
jgi:hypothetical protein